MHASAPVRVAAWRRCERDGGGPDASSQTERAAAASAAAAFFRPIARGWLRLEVAFVTNDRERDEKLKLAENYLRPTLLENDRYIVMPYTTWNIWDRSLPSYLMLYDRKTKECIKVKDGAFVNDMMGDLPFCPDVRIAENVLAEWWDASELMELAEEGVMLPDNLKNLKEDDNGVLALVHLKK